MSRKRPRVSQPHPPPQVPLMPFLPPHGSSPRWVSIAVITDRNASAAQVLLCDSNRVLMTATGSAKRKPHDQADPAIADGLALGRALVHLGRQLCEEQMTAVRAADMRRQAAVSRRIQRVNRRVLERAFPQHHDLTAEQIEAEYGTAAADRHTARKARWQPAREQGEAGND